MNVGGLRGEALDRLGVVASMVCAIHCFLGVIVATSAGAWRLFGDERLELPLVIVALLFAGTSIGFGFRRHRRRTPPALLALGVALILLARTIDVGETLLSITGAFVLIAAHVANLRASRQCC